MTAGLVLSRRQLHAARRLPGIELMLPWPAELPPPAGTAGFERRASQPEWARARQAVADECRRHGLVVRSVRAAIEERPGDHAVLPWLVVEIGDRAFGAAPRRNIHPVTCWPRLP